jgi:hypothetical protein
MHALLAAFVYLVQIISESVLVCELFPVILRLLTHKDLFTVSCAVLALWNLARDEKLR